MKKNGCFLRIMMLLFVMLALPAINVNAANPVLKSLKANKTYSSYDITGNHKKDKLRIKSTVDKNSLNTVKITVNGKTVYTLSDVHYYDLKIKYFRLSNGKPFLYLYGIGDNGDGPCGILQYASGKMKMIADFSTFYKSYGMHQNGTIVKVSGNTITVKASVMSWALGLMETQHKYNYQKGTLKRENTGTITKTLVSYSGEKYFTAKKNITAYTSPTSNKKTNTIKKDSKVAIKKCWYNGKKLYLQATLSNGKKCWFRSPTKPYYDNTRMLFNEAQYSG